MATEIKVPTLGESITEATVIKWLKGVGESVAVDELLVELETDKVAVEVPSPVAGKLTQIVASEGMDVEVGAVLALVTEGAGATASKSETVSASSSQVDSASASSSQVASASAETPLLSPVVRKLLEENNLDATAIVPTGAKGRLTKVDVLNYLKSHATPASAPAAPAPTQAPAAPPPPAAPKPAAASAPAPTPASKPALSLGAQFPPGVEGPREERVRMSRLRKRIAERLKEAQNTAAMLTTFNEVDMTAVMALRKQYQGSFEKLHGIRLGFMSFFTKACVSALQSYPAVNAEIQGDEMVYKNYYDIGVAVGTEQGLVVPMVRDADKLSLAQIEGSINDLGRRAREGKLGLDDLQGGTFTITNGGIFGSLLSTPILNTPQSAILGMHKIQQRAMVMPDGTIAARPMMYLALSYDHRIIDGKEAVSFLVRVKECIEDPTRIMLGA
ncbi:MAG: 2-oxoglutarate dehydrogenase complex dihydrolipoyllysine-residue succinyltransferase [Magnetococcales bacterium]|nr:2-oxoglutarate dehydrogenase complex dihydrolipoyllysine-residue succinyltransferase [Magnetococcales bacterium]